MSRRVLMSPVDAAGYAMAPPEDDVPADNAAPDEALRNGHALAARSSGAMAQQIKAMGREARRHMMVDSLAGWWNGKAPA